MGMGDKERPYIFKGYKNKTLFAEKRLSKSRSWNYEVTCSKHSLHNEDCYDALRISVRKVDQNGTLMSQGNDSLLLETEGPIEIMGPKVVSS